MGKRKRARRGSDQIQVRVSRVGVVTCSARYTEHGERKFTTLKAIDEDAAKIELAEMLLRIRKGQPAIATVALSADGVLTVKALAERFCGVADEFKSGAGAEHRDPVHYRRQAWSVLQCHVLPHIGHMPATTVKPRDIKIMKQSLLDGKKHNRTVTWALATCSRLFNWAILDAELLEHINPCVGVKKPKSPPSVEHYSEDEIARLLSTAATKMPELYAPLVFAYYTACRKGEIASAEWGDVDLEAGRIIIKRSWKTTARKSGEPVVAHIHPRLGVVLQAHRDRQAPESSSSLVFPGAGGRMLDRYGDWGLRKLVELAEVRKFAKAWHAVRHAAATSLALSGAGLAEIQAALGQSSLEMAKRYTHLAGNQVRERIMSLPTLGPLPPVVDIGAAAQDRHKLGKRQATQSS